MNKEKKSKKPKYNMWQNSAFMISLAIREKEKKVLIIGLAAIVLNLSRNLLNLYITPAVLGAVETQAALGQLLTLIFAFIGLSMLLCAAQNYTNNVSQVGRIDVRMAISALIQKKAATTSYPNMGDEKFQELLTKAFDSTSNNRSSTEAVWNTLRSLIENTAGFLIYLALLSAVNPLLIVVVTLTSVIGYLINKPLSEYRYRHRAEEAEYTVRLRYLTDCFTDTKMAKDIRLFGMHSWLEELYDKAMDACTAFQKRAENVYIWGRIADLVLAFLRNGIAYAYLVYLVLNKDLAVSLFLLYFTAAGNFSSWVSGILKDMITLHKQCLDIANIRELLEYPEPFRFEEGESLVPDMSREYEIRLEDVSFRYPNAEKDTLSHINLTLHAGEKLAVVGLNGAGKTTLIKLLCGFLDPTKGRVLLNGKDIREYNRRDYYRMFAAVFQDFSLLASTIAVNVAQTEDSIDMETVKKSIAKAGLTEKIESLPAQYDTKLDRKVYDDAAMLSGGEVQRLMLARALYKNAPFIVLDEPTAALDPIAEADLYSKYNEMTQGHSSVYISHRLASTRFCDRIILIENGCIAEEGTHESLLAVGGSYANLFEIQSKYYRKETLTDGKQ